jgi:hypothetical protein
MFKERTMPTTQSEDDKKRRRNPIDPTPGSDEAESGGEDDETVDLEDDQADSGPDSDRKDLGG